MQNVINQVFAWKQARPIAIRDEEGQTVVEYALVVGLVSLVIIGVLATAGSGWITSIGTKITSKIGTIA